MEPFDVCGALRRIRRMADLSQRELATVTGLSVSSIAHAEAGTRDLSVGALMTVAAVAGLRVALLDENDHEVGSMSADTVRDMSGRRFPAHLDTRYSSTEWHLDPYRSDRRQPWYTFDRDRWTRDKYRARRGTPEDHQVPQPGDSPEERKAQRRREARRRAAEEQQGRREAAGWQRAEWFVCSCPPRCDELDDFSTRPVHAGECPCLCDLG